MKPFSEIISGDTPTLVDFYATWCAPCKAMKPILEDLKTKIGDKATILKIDVDKNPNVSRTYNIQGVPTLILFRKGEILWRGSGIAQSDFLKNLIEGQRS